MILVTRLIKITKLTNSLAPHLINLKSCSGISMDRIFRILYILSLISPLLCEATPGPQMWEVHVGTGHKTIDNLVNSGTIDHWSSLNDKIQFVVGPGEESIVKRALSQASLSYEVVEDDLLSLIKREEEHLTSKKRRRKRSANQMDWTSYHKLEDIEGYLGWINSTQRGRVQVFPVALTAEGRRVYVAKVTDGIPGNNKKKIWIEGGIHAREWISPAVTTYLLHQVATSPEFRPLLKETEWYFVPVANPDGYQYSFSGGFARMWRKNRRRNGFLLRGMCRGIDLNRNWPLKWGVGASSNPCSNVYKGSKPFSEPETDGLRRVMQSEGPFDLFITFHSFGQTVLYPWGWTKNPPRNHNDLANLGNKFIEAVELASKGKTTYRLGGSAEIYGLASGASDDWSYGELGVPYSYTIELRDNGKFGFLLPENQIVDSIQETSVGVYCMASYMTGIGVCGRSEANEVEPRQIIHRSSSSRIIFE